MDAFALKDIKTSLMVDWPQTAAWTPLNVEPEFFCSFCSAGQVSP